MNPFQRRHGFRNPKKFFIIATEGERTEAIYFNALKPGRDAKIQLKVLPTKSGHSNPKEVMARLRQYERDYGAGSKDELWLVIDRDHWVDADLDFVAREIIGKPKYNLALSNPRFELWLVLHFQDNPPSNAADYEATLKKHLGAFKKTDYDAHKMTKLAADAVRRAEKMDQAPKTLWPRQTGTRVYRLARRILESAQPEHSESLSQG